jgi:hypothetical protein
MVQGAVHKKNEKIMTNKESVERNIGLTFDYVNYLMDHPAEVDKLPAKFKVEFIEKDFPKIEKSEPAKQIPVIKRKYVRVRNSFEMTP